MATDSEVQARHPFLRSAYHISIPASTVATPLGTLSILPRELRDKIYKLLCSDAYYSLSEHSRLKRPRRRRRSPRRLADLKMTGLSKSIRQEYLPVLHAEAIFTMPESQLYLGRDLTLDDIPFVDQIQKVEISEDLDDLLRCSWLCYKEWIGIRGENEELFFKKDAKPFSLFIGTGITRKVCVIRLTFEQPQVVLIIQSPLFDAIRRLTEFKTLTLEIDGPETDSSFDSPWASGVLSYRDRFITGDDPSHMEYAGALSLIAHLMKSALEPSLGPSGMSEERLESSIRWEIKFHPRDYLAKKTKSEAGAGGQVVEAKEDLNQNNDG